MSNKLNENKSTVDDEIVITKKREFKNNKFAAENREDKLLWKRIAEREKIKGIKAEPQKLKELREK